MARKHNPKWRHQPRPALHGEACGCRQHGENQSLTKLSGGIVNGFVKFRGRYARFVVNGVKYLIPKTWGVYPYMDFCCIYTTRKIVDGMEREEEVGMGGEEEVKAWDLERENGMHMLRQHIRLFRESHIATLACGKCLRFHSHKEW